MYIELGWALIQLVAIIRTRSRRLPESSAFFLDEMART